MLRIIEEIHGEDDAMMQNSFQAYDDCSGKSILIFNPAMKPYFCIAYCLFCKSGNPDECQLAAEIYQCGRDVAPTITTEIFTRSKGNATVVSFIIIKYLICVTAV
jgi:hypothetical protein